MAEFLPDIFADGRCWKLRDLCDLCDFCWQHFVHIPGKKWRSGDLDPTAVLFCPKLRGLVLP